MLAARFFDDSAFFRVVDNFVVQFGISGDPDLNTMFEDEIDDDEVSASNLKGTISFAKADKPNTRTTQLFINLKDNTSLDSKGSAPFAGVVAGMGVLEAVNNPTPDDHGGVDQSDYIEKGALWIDQHYPDISHIKTAYYLGADGSGGGGSSQQPVEPSSMTGKNSSSKVNFLVISLLTVSLLLSCWANIRNFRPTENVGKGYQSDFEEYSQDLELTNVDNNSKHVDDDENNVDWNNPFAQNEK